jgi:O-antigen ligase
MLGLYSFFSIAMVINMFITGGRAGQIVFLVMITLLIFQYFREQRIKALIVILIIIPTIFIFAYQSSTLYKQRTLQVIEEIVNFPNQNLYSENKLTLSPHQVLFISDQNICSSVGSRLFYTINSWEIIKENVLLGAGTGDFPSEYKKISAMTCYPSLEVNNPHNMYILVLAQLGIVGLVSMLSIIYYQIKLSFAGSNKFFRDVGFALPLLFLVIMWSDSYLLGHFTGLLFVFFSSFLYKDFEKS